MTNILFISQFLANAGTETFMMNVLRNIDKSRFHVDFLIFDTSITTNSIEAERLGARIFRLPSRKSSPSRYFRELDKFFSEKGSNYNAIHFCGGSLSSIAPIYYAYKHGVPVRIIHSHSSSANGIHNRILHKINRKFTYKLGTHFFSCSSLASDWFFPNNKEAIVIKNGIDLKQFAYDENKRNRLRTKNDISPETHIIGHVGRFVEVKNQKMIIDIFHKYLNYHSNSLLFLVGNGPLMDDVKLQVGTYGIEDKVRFLGERTDIPDLMQIMDCFLMPSIFEGLPFVLIEAQATGLPCVIADTINADAKITPYLQFLSLSDSVGEWCSTISDLITKTERINTGHYLSEAGYSIDDTVDYLEKIYKQ